MIKVEYTAQPCPFGDLPDLLELKMTLGDNVTWDEATKEFCNFLRAAGYKPPEPKKDETYPEDGPEAVRIQADGPTLFYTYPDQDISIPDGHRRVDTERYLEPDPYKMRSVDT